MKSQETINALNEEQFKQVHEKLDLILEQTTKTNGRVTSLEMWRSYLIGAWAVVMLIIYFIR